MLQCTQAAADALRDVRRQRGIPEEFGLRVSATQTEGGVALQLGFAEQPQAGDEVTEDHGQRLFVAPEIAEGVANMAIDVTEPTSSDGSQPQELVLRRTSP
jgi:Fe-S cluster assembly iron-binding protein IscA